MKVNIDYHIEVGHHYYSVPFRLMRERLDVRLTATTVEAFNKGERVADHARSYVWGGHTTLKEHMLPEYRKYVGVRHALSTGRATMIPIHKGESVVRSLLRKIMQDAELSREEFLKLL